MIFFLSLKNLSLYKFSVLLQYYCSNRRQIECYERTYIRLVSTKTEQNYLWIQNLNMDMLCWSTICEFPIFKKVDISYKHHKTSYKLAYVQSLNLHCFKLLCRELNFKANLQTIEREFCSFTERKQREEDSEEKTDL